MDESEAILDSALVAHEKQAAGAVGIVLDFVALHFVSAGSIPDRVAYCAYVGNSTAQNAEAVGVLAIADVGTWVCLAYVCGQWTFQVGCFVSERIEIEIVDALGVCGYFLIVDFGRKLDRAA